MPRRRDPAWRGPGCAVADRSYTRIPVYRGARDRVIGIVNTKQLALRRLRGTLPARSPTSCSRRRPRPPTTSGDRLLTLFRERRTHHAIVVDERASRDRAGHPRGRAARVPRHDARRRGDRPRIRCGSRGAARPGARAWIARRPDRRHRGAAAAERAVCRRGVRHRRCCRAPSIERRARSGERVARTVQQTLEDPRRQDRFIATAQLGITLASLGLGMYGEHVLAEWLAHLFEAIGAARFIAAHTRGQHRRGGRAHLLPHRHRRDDPQVAGAAERGADGAVDHAA